MLDKEFISNNWALLSVGFDSKKVNTKVDKEYIFIYYKKERSLRHRSELDCGYGMPSHYSLPSSNTENLAMYHSG